MRSQRETLGDAHHQPAIHDDSERRRHGHDHPLLKAAERHQEQSRSQLVAGQQPDQLTYLLLGRGRQEHRHAARTGDDEGR